jgi:hypothetical protein
VAFGVFHAFSVYLSPCDSASNPPIDRFCRFGSGFGLAALVRRGAESLGSLKEYCSVVHLGYLVSGEKITTIKPCDKQMKI